MRNALRLLVLLAAITQGFVLFATWYEIAAMLRGDIGMDVAGTALMFLPSVLGFGGAAVARSLHRRGSGWAWVVVAVPLLLLALALCLAAFLWANPIRH